MATNETLFEARIKGAAEKIIDTFRTERLRLKDAMEALAATAAALICHQADASPVHKGGEEAMAADINSAILEYVKQIRENQPNGNEA